MPVAHSSVIGIFQVCAIGQPEIRTRSLPVNRRFQVGAPARGFKVAGRVTLD